MTRYGPLVRSAYHASFVFKMENFSETGKKETENETTEEIQHREATVRESEDCLVIELPEAEEIPEENLTPVSSSQSRIDYCFCPYCDFNTASAKELANHIVLCHGENFDHERVEQNRFKNRFRHSDFPGIEQVIFPKF